MDTEGIVVGLIIGLPVGILVGLFASQYLLPHAAQASNEESWKWTDYKGIEHEIMVHRKVNESG